MKSVSIKAKLMLVLALILTISIGGMLFALLYQEEALKEKKADAHIEELTYSIIQSIVFIMDQGADDVSPIVEEMSKIENIKQLRVYATDLISEEDAEKMDDLEKSVVQSREELLLDEIFDNERVHTAIKPILATESCLMCHEGDEGDPLAVITLRYSVDDTYQSIASQRINGILMLIAIVLGSLGISYFVMNKLVIKDLHKTTDLMNQLANGDLSSEIVNNRNDEFGKFYDAILNVRKSFHNLLDDANRLAKAAEEGRLSERADVNQHQGEFAKVIEGLNNTLNGVVSPLKITADYIHRISRGDIPDKITAEFHGDYNEMKNNVNQCIEAINLLVSDTKLLINSATLGKLNDRADAMQHQGDFRRIVRGVNQTLDRLVGLIDNLPLPVQIVDKNYKILYINKKAEYLSRN